MSLSSSDNQIQWYTQYDHDHPPLKPDGFVRFVVISDTHSTQPKIPDGVCSDNEPFCDCVGRLTLCFIHFLDRITGCFIALGRFNRYRRYKSI